MYPPKILTVELLIPKLNGNKYEDLAAFAISLRASLQKMNINMSKLIKWREQHYDKIQKE